MEVNSVISVGRSMWACSVMEAMVVETAVSTWKSLASLIFLAGSLLNDINASPVLTAMDKRFPLDELFKMEQPVAENKDASDTEDDDEDEDDDNVDQDDDAGDEDFSAGEGVEEADPEANGEGGSDNGDDDDGDEDDGDEDDDEEDGEDEEEEEEEEEDEEVPQPPSKKRK